MVINAFAHERRGLMTLALSHRQQSRHLKKQFANVCGVGGSSYYNDFSAQISTPAIRRSRRWFSNRHNLVFA